MQVVCIRDRQLTGSLNFRTRAQCLAISEVTLQSQAVPLSHPDGDERGIVISVAKAGVHTHSGRQLSVSTTRSGSGCSAASQRAARVYASEAFKPGYERGRQVSGGVQKAR